MTGASKGSSESDCDGKCCTPEGGGSRKCCGHGCGQAGESRDQFEDKGGEATLLAVVNSSFSQVLSVPGFGGVNPALQLSSSAQQDTINQNLNLEQGSAFVQ